MHILLCRMEQGEVKSWNETDNIDRICSAHAQRHNTVPQSNTWNTDKTGNAKAIPCVYCNKGTCTQKQDTTVIKQIKGGTTQAGGVHNATFAVNNNMDG